MGENRDGYRRKRKVKGAVCPKLRNRHALPRRSFNGYGIKRRFEETRVLRLKKPL